MLREGDIERATTADGSTGKHDTVQLCDHIASLIDDLSGLNLAIRGLSDMEERRGLSAMIERARDIAEHVAEMADKLHKGA